MPRRRPDDRRARGRDTPGGSRPERRSEPTAPEPDLPEEISAQELDREARAALRSLSKTAADTVARRLVAAGELLDVDPRLALRHALAARRRASRVPAVREAVGLAAYRCAEWQLAVGELRAFHRMTGRQTHLPVLADCERGLGRPERAVDMLRHVDRKTLETAEWVELLIVAAGARRDLGQSAASVATLQVPALQGPGAEPWRARLRYAYADALAEVGRTEEARRWFARAAETDRDGATDAADRLLELQGVVISGDDYPDEESEEVARQPDADPAGSGRDAAAQDTAAADAARADHEATGPADPSATGTDAGAR